MKLTLVLPLVFALCLSLGCTSSTEKTIPAPIEGTDHFLPSKTHQKVKIPGRCEQVLKANSAKTRRWKNIGPGYVNVLTNVELNGDTITMMIDIGGLMQSKDGGKSWDYITYQLEHGITGRSFFDFDISPSDKKNIVIGSNSIFKTNDGGKTWQEIRHGLPKSIYGTRTNGFGQVKFNSDGSRVFTATGTKVFMPVGWEKLFSKHYTHKTLFVSDNNAESFNELKLDPPFAPIARIYPHPNNPETVYVSFKDGSFYMTKNAKAQRPALHKQKIPTGYFVQDMTISPEDSNYMLLTLAQTAKKKTDAKVYRCHNCMDAKMELQECVLKEKSGHTVTGREFMSIGFNPNLPRQIVIGSSYNDYILISEDDLKTVRKLHLPKTFYYDDLEGDFYGKIERVFFGNSTDAVIISRIGSWITRDNFKTLEDLTMVYNDGFFGNNGIGSPANVNGMALTHNNLYWSAQDHRAWRSNGKDHTKWKKITPATWDNKIPQQPAPWGELTWFWGIERIFASKDDKYVYINADAWGHKFKGNKFWQNKKFFVSYDQGNTWQDMTKNIGKGDVYPGNSQFLKVLFDSEDSSTQWLLFSDALYLSNNGGKSFIPCNSPLFKNITRKEGQFFSDLAYDSKHNLLYLSACVKDNELNQKLKHSLFHSKDMGKTWDVYDADQNAIKSLAVTTSGALAIGTMKSADQPARLIVIPYGKKYNENMVKMTMGDTPEEISANQLSFWPIIADGNDILAYANINWVHSDRFFAQGPLLSTNDGKSFKWINYDLPCNNIWSADMKDGKIIIGTIFGIMEMDYLQEKI